MSQDKGQPSQPASLPDALAGLAEPQGHPEALYDMSKDFSRAADQLDAIDGDEYRLLIQVHGPWEGVAEKSFLSQMGKRLAAYHDIAAGYRKAGSALKDYASALENAQQVYAASRQLTGADHFRQMGLRSHNPAYVFDLFSPDRVRARSQVEAALERLRGATLRTGAVLKVLESTMGKRTQVKPGIYRGKRESWMQAGGEVREKATEDVQAFCDTYRYVQPGYAKQAWQEYIDEQIRFYSNPVTYVGDEAYDFFNVEEFQAGNYARGLAGFGYNLVTRGSVKWIRVINPDGRRKDDNKEEKEKKSVCSPFG